MQHTSQVPQYIQALVQSFWLSSKRVESVPNAKYLKETSLGMNSFFTTEDLFEDLSWELLHANVSDAG